MCNARHFAPKGATCCKDNDRCYKYLAPNGAKSASLNAITWPQACLGVRQTSMPENEKEETNRKAGIAYAAAFSLFGAVVAGLLLGWLLDRWLGTKPWLLVAGVTLGSIAGFYEFIRATSKLS